MLSVGDAMVPQKVPPQLSLQLMPAQSCSGIVPWIATRTLAVMRLGSAKPRSSAPVVGSVMAMGQRPDGQTMARPTVRLCDIVGTGMPVADQAAEQARRDRLDAVEPRLGEPDLRRPRDARLWRQGIAAGDGGDRSPGTARATTAATS